MGAHNSILSGRFGDPSGRPGDRCRIWESWHVCFWLITIVVLINQSIISTIKVFILNHQSKNLIIATAISIVIISRALIPLLNDMPPPPPAPYYRCDTLDLLKLVQLGGMYSLAAKCSNNKLGLFFYGKLQLIKRLRITSSAKLQFAPHDQVFSLLVVYYLLSVHNKKYLCPVHP